MYTKLFTFGESDDEPGARALVALVSGLLVYDAQYELFYVTAWNVGKEERYLAAEDVQEVWRVILLNSNNIDLILLQKIERPGHHRGVFIFNGS